MTKENEISIEFETVKELPASLKKTSMRYKELLTAFDKGTAKLVQLNIEGLAPITVATAIRKLIKENGLKYKIHQRQGQIFLQK